MNHSRRFLYQLLLYVLTKGFELGMELGADLQSFTGTPQNPAKPGYVTVYPVPQVRSSWTLSYNRLCEGALSDENGVLVNGYADFNW